MELVKLILDGQYEKLPFYVHPDLLHFERRISKGNFGEVYKGKPKIGFKRRLININFVPLPLIIALVVTKEYLF